MKKQSKKYIVFYVKDLTMREQMFDNKEDAEAFANSVNSEVISINI